MLDGKLVSYHIQIVVALEVDESIWFNLTVNVAIYISELIPDISLLKLKSGFVGFWDDKIIEIERHTCNNQGSYHVGQQEPVETHPRTEDGNNFCVVRHF